MKKRAKAGDVPHTGLAVFATGVMALGLAVGLEFLKILGHVNGFLAAAFRPEGMAPPTRPVDPVFLWGAAVLIAFGLPAVMLNVAGMWRRAVLWGGTFVLTLSWAPVLLLASFLPETAVALVAVLWSGFCAMTYAANHVLPADRLTGKTNPVSDGSR